MIDKATLSSILDIELLDQRDTFEPSYGYIYYLPKDGEGSKINVYELMHLAKEYMFIKHKIALSTSPLGECDVFYLEEEVYHEAMFRDSDELSVAFKAVNSLYDELCK